MRVFKPQLFLLFYGETHETVEKEDEIQAIFVLVKIILLQVALKICLSCS